tara:strand:- start:206 stop:979 length:774 start_codon:yes stop_codon:yes gene_type:complete
MLYNPNKKGTIILSHYRSGGTRLIQTSWLAIGEKNTTNLSEWNHTIAHSSSEYETGVPNPSEFLFRALEKCEKYSLLLINYPVDICNFHNNGVFEKLKDDYEIVVLERKNKINCFLSLPLWEMFIKSGLFKNPKKWTKENMMQFHKDRINYKIGVKGLSLGYTTQTPHINGLLKDFTSDILMLRTISDKYNFPIIYYEDYENNEEHFVNLFPNIDKEHVLKVAKITNKKIPYVSNDYTEYYHEDVVKHIKGWKLNEL